MICTVFQVLFRIRTIRLVKPWFVPHIIREPSISPTDSNVHDEIEFCTHGHNKLRAD